MGFVGQVFHVFRKDLTRFWPWLAGAGLVAWLDLADITGRVWIVSAFGGWGITELLPLFLVGFAAMAVLEDGPGVNLPFWVSRPISPAAVVWGKLLLVFGLLVLLPAAAQVFWLLRFGEASAGPLLLDTLVMHGGLVALVVLAAVVSGSVVGFLALTLAGWVGYGVAQGSLGLDFLSTQVRSAEVAMTRVYMEHLGWLVIGCALTVYQYVRRDSVRTLTVGALALVALLAYVRNAQLDWTGPSTPGDLQPLVAGARIPALDPQSLQWISVPIGPEGEDVPAMAAHLSSNPGPGTVAVTRDPRVRLLTDSPEDLAAMTGPFGVMNNWQQSLRTLTELDGAPILFPSPHAPRMRVPIAWGELDPLKRRLETAWGFEARVLQDVFELRVAARLPLVEGAVQRFPEAMASVEEVDRRGGLVSATVEVSGPARYLSPSEPEIPGVVAVFLYNRARGELLGSSGGGGGPAGRAAPLVAGASLATQKLRVQFGPPVEAMRYGQPPLPEGWFDDVELWVVAAEYLGTTESSLRARVSEWPEFAMGQSVGPEGITVLPEVLASRVEEVTR